MVSSVSPEPSTRFKAGLKPPCWGLKTSYLPVNKPLEGSDGLCFPPPCFACAWHSVAAEYLLNDATNELFLFFDLLEKPGEGFEMG